MFPGFLAGLSLAISHRFIDRLIIYVTVNNRNLSKVHFGRSSLLPRTKAPGPKKTAYHHGDLTEAARNAALSFLEKQSVEALSLRELAKGLGVSHAALYRHFADKQALLVEVATSGFLMMTRELERAARQVCTAERERLFHVLSAYLEFAKAHTACFRLMYGPELSDRAAFPNLSKVVDEGHYFLRDILAKAQQNGEIADGNLDLIVSTALVFAQGMALIEINQLARSTALREIDREQLYQHAWQVLWNGLGGRNLT